MGKKYNHRKVVFKGNFIPHHKITYGYKYTIKKDILIIYNSKNYFNSFSLNHVNTYKRDAIAIAFLDWLKKQDKMPYIKMQEELNKIIDDLLYYEP